MGTIAGPSLWFNILLFAILKFSWEEEERAVHFHFVLDFTNEVASSGQGKVVFALYKGLRELKTPYHSGYNARQRASLMLKALGKMLGTRIFSALGCHPTDCREDIDCNSVIKEGNVFLPWRELAEPLKPSNQPWPVMRST